ncbi:ABC transporter substrate-binding protein [Microbacterium lacus]|uniref:ABC transporter substrate-binding protein n=1 Tax=Microbacterium lacus TaxID=415217 RepID=UPI0012FDDB5F|nr:ABC transporter substrate-binding protein [Microbacterium lacus]
MKSLRTRAPLTLGISVLAVLGLAACGAQTDAGTDSSADTSDAPMEVQPLVAGVIPVTDIGPVYMAQQNGVFEENGFDLTLQPAGSSTEIIQAMQSGQVQIGYGGSTGVFQAVENGVDLVIIAAASATPDDPENGINDLLVTADSPLESAKDLEGKTVAVNAPGGYTQLLGDIAVAADGGDPSLVNYVQMGVPDQPAALASGAIDAFVAGEPFGTLGREQNGFRTLANPFTALSDSAVIAGVWYALRADVEEDPEYYERVAATIDEANAYAFENDEELRENIAEFTKIDPELAARIRLGSYGKLPLTIDNLQAIADWSFELGYVKNEVDLDGLVWVP